MFSIQFIIFFLLTLYICFGNKTTKVNKPKTKTTTVKKIEPIKVSNNTKINKETKKNHTEKVPKTITVKKTTAEVTTQKEINDISFTPIDENIIPIIQKRLDNERIKKSLSEFTMVRRKTHFTLPYFKPKEISKESNIQDIVYTPYGYNDYNKKTNPNGIRTDLDYTDTYNELFPENRLYNMYPDYEEESKIINLLRKQTEIIKKLAETIEMDNRKVNKISDFDRLLNEVQEKQDLAKKFGNYTNFTFETTTRKTTTKMTTTEKPTTILTLFDEVQVRNALRSDPYVKRILKMANRKRERYLKNARRFHNRNLNRRMSVIRHHNLYY